jgi:hypothetical protein
MNVRTPFVANAEATKLMQPSIGTLDNPAKCAQTTAVFGIAFGQHGFNSPSDQGSAVVLGIVSPVPLHSVRTLARSAALSRNGGNGIHQREQLRYIVAIRARDGGGQRKTVRIGKDMVLRTVFPPIRRVRPSLVPPKTARTLQLSTTARDQSIWSVPWRWLRIMCRMSCHTPASCQSRSLRQQVIPHPQPISRGRSSQGMPVFSTNRMPLRAWRSGTKGRPPLGWALGGGRHDSMTAHSSSVSNGLAMNSSSMTRKSCLCPCNHRLDSARKNRFC